MTQPKRYAATTTVTVEKSKADIEAVLKRYGADQFMYAWETDTVVMAFRIDNLPIRMVVPVPAIDEFRYADRKSKWETRQVQRTPAQMQSAWQQAERQLWRALLLVVKAKLEAVEAGISTLEDEFLAQVVMPNNLTVKQNMMPAIRDSITSGKIMPMLQAGGV